MKRYVMNDYELIYLIKYESDHIALEYLYHKYEKLIWKNIHQFNPKKSELDDLFQEGVLTLYKAVLRFDSDRGKSFTRYFELILRRRLLHCINHLPDYVLHELPDFCQEACYIIEESSFEASTRLEALIYQAYFIERQTIDMLVVNLKVEKKSIYNTIYRIRQKHKNML